MALRSPCVQFHLSSGILSDEISSASSSSTLEPHLEPAIVSQHIPQNLYTQSDKILALTNAASVELEPIWASLLAKALEGKNVKDLLSNVGAGGGAPAAGSAPAAGGAGGAAPEAEKKEEKVEEKEESDDDMVCTFPLWVLDEENGLLIVIGLAGFRTLRLICFFVAYVSLPCFIHPACHSYCICNETLKPKSPTAYCGCACYYPAHSSRVSLCLVEYCAHMICYDHVP